MSQTTKRQGIAWPRRRFLQLALGLAGTIPFIPLAGRGRAHSKLSRHEAVYYHPVG
jgi:hypothetical protein